MDWMLLGIPVGAVMLYLGSEWMVRGAKGLALRLGVSPMVIGVTVVALGTSSPEFFTSLVSGEAPQIIIGNIVGSNIANVGLALGLTAVAGTVVVDYGSLRFEAIVLMLAVGLVTLLSLDGILGTCDGFLLLFCVVLFVLMSYLSVRGKEPSGEKEVEAHPPFMLLALMAVGAVFLYVGARSFIAGAQCMAEIVGVSEMAIGLIVVALGACLPETCISIVAAHRGETDLAAANILGSIIFNSFFALGTGALVTDIPIAESMLSFHLPYMVFSAAVMFLLLRFRDRISRPAGVMLVCLYLFYLCMMYFSPLLTV